MILLGLAEEQRRIAAATDQMVERLIEEGTITRPRWWVSQRGRFGLFVLTLLMCAVISLVYQLWLNDRSHSQSLPNGAELATALVAAAASMFGYYQWTDSRRETSLDKFYDRLSLVNERYYQWKAARLLVRHFWGNSTDDNDFEKTMYTYVELDNLEYMIFRYQLGFVRKPLLRRAVRTFSSRCQSEEFSILAKQLVNGAGYDVKTVQVVSLLATFSSNAA